jgi:hypothetical protein
MVSLRDNVEVAFAGGGVLIAIAIITETRGCRCGPRLRLFA